MPSHESLHLVFTLLLKALIADLCLLLLVQVLLFLVHRAVFYRNYYQSCF